MLGAAYVYFDVKDRLWKPLAAQVANASILTAQP
jgi:hypothetical protein